ncbi:MAG: PD-(D/E)XK nuclease family protein [Anaerolineae bacterium]
MGLLPEFQFSQGNLQDYVDCPRRFQLRYLLQLTWPAIEAEPADEYEAQVRAGEAFHRLVQQHILGIIPAAGTDLLLDEPLAGWWRAYLSSQPADLPALRFAEVVLSAGLGSHRLIAKYDLIAIEPGHRAVIVDWKTSARRPRPTWLAERIQTRVYRYLLVRAGAHLMARPRPGDVSGSAGIIKGEIRPEQVEMIYWFANFPDEPERLRYDAIQFAADDEYLAELAAEITRRDDPVFPLTDDVRRCLFCTYRSLCGRGAVAGDFAAADDDTLIAADEPSAGWTDRFDIEQIAEIAF